MYFILYTAQPDIDMSLWGLVLKGGWLMLPIFLLSLIAIYIACERFIAIRRISVKDSGLIQEIGTLLRARKREEALARCKDEHTPLGRIIGKGIRYMQEPTQEIRQLMEDRANYEVAVLEKGMATLATCAGTAPMIGFLGTVVGMVQAFYDMAMAGNNIDIGLLSRGIYTAMITTVAGLIVGIIGNLAYNYLVSMIDKEVHHMEKDMAALLDIIRELN